MTALLTLLAAGLAAGPAPDPARFVRIERLSDRVLLAYWLGTGRCNLTAIRTQKGLVIIDTERSPRIMAPIKARIEQTFGRSDWAYVINTHAHDSHAGGNALFKGAAIVGHENLPRDMEWLTRKLAEPDFKRRDLDFARKTLQNLEDNLPRMAGRPADARRIEGEMLFWQLYIEDMEAGHEIVKPTRTFTDTRTLDLGDVTLELVFFGRSHSLSDTLVYVPQERLLVTGGVVYQRAHLPEVAEEATLADVLRYMSVLDRFCADDVRIDRVVPSHSPPLLKKDLPPVRDYYRRMLEGVRQARREGLTREQAAARLDLRKSFPAFNPAILGRWAGDLHGRNLANLWRITEEAATRPQ